MYDHFQPPMPEEAGQLATLLDVTLRDGGFELDFHWPESLFATIPATLSRVGVDVVELGYIGGVPLEHSVATPGIGAFVHPEHVRAARNSGLRLAAMIHPSALSQAVDIEAYANAGLDILRLVYHPSWIDGIAEVAREASSYGLTVSINIALASRYEPNEVLIHAERVQTSMRPDIIYIADTCGALFPNQVGGLVQQLRTIPGIAVGFHGHDSLSMAYANTLAAVAAGAEYADISVLGLGRGGGNLQAELVTMRHRLAGNPMTPSAAARLSSTRALLASLTSHRLPPLLPTTCGILNLTPPEEQALTEFAVDAQVETSVAALWFLSASHRVPSMQKEDLLDTWQHDLLLADDGLD